MSKFKTGDRVKVIRPGAYNLLLGAEYTVLGYDHEGFTLLGTHPGDGWDEDRFELVESPLPSEWVEKIKATENGTQVLQELGVLPKPKVEKHAVQVQFHLTTWDELSPIGTAIIADSITRAIGAPRLRWDKNLRGPVTVTPYTYYEEV